jgi:hypothetical protein
MEESYLQRQLRPAQKCNYHIPKASYIKDSRELCQAMFVIIAFPLFISFPFHSFLSCQGGTNGYLSR